MNKKIKIKINNNIPAAFAATACAAENIQN